MSLSVYAPATIANIGMGFDLLGAAIEPVDQEFLGDIIHVEKAAAGIKFDCSGPWRHKLPQDVNDNIVLKCAGHFIERLPAGGKCGINMRLEKNLPVGSGLGSSASSIVAAFYALNELLERPFSSHELLLMMGEFEGQISGSVHYDNIAPCCFGGMQLMLQAEDRICDEIPYFKDWLWVVAYPGISLSTAKMRGVLPDKYCRRDLIDFGRLLAGYIHAVYNDDASLAAQMIEDRVAEPYRKSHIPGYEDAKKAVSQLGALAAGISGSGPTMFAVADDHVKANTIRDWLKDNYLSEAGGFAHVCKIDSRGTRIINV